MGNSVTEIELNLLFDSTGEEVREELDEEVRKINKIRNVKVNLRLDVNPER